MALNSGDEATARAALHEADAIGIDLDLTLIDTRAATAHALRAVNHRCGESIDVEAFVARLGPPIRQELAQWVAPERIPRAVEVFRQCFVDEGTAHLMPLPGALDLADALTTAGRRLVVITSRIPPVATACLAACGIEASTVVGGVTGKEKSPAMTACGVGVYVGDHELDMLAAGAAGVPGVGVTTGSHEAGELVRAGAAWVVDSLAEVTELVRG
jgi:phosphoglycolate phosphatase